MEQECLANEQPERSRANLYWLVVGFGVALIIGEVGYFFGLFKAEERLYQSCVERVYGGVDPVPPFRAVDCRELAHRVRE